ncbi:response regulator [Geotoga petraea]|uniref:Diguanylate cyclase (GGDEF) domain-containing protein n=1 Tax=Geotoga petraea TaxID=28234 RepID=A0A1G6HMF4_9BACT|nr:response regulator [Geotoga petraea]SDB95374.1 diguanylate cyclase (GGDEF) domain-containing protein [Geotoga petraea]
MTSNNSPREIANSVYWLSPNIQPGSLRVNQYLIVNDNDIILIDPGPIILFEQLKDTVNEIINFEQINNILVTSADIEKVSSLQKVIDSLPKKPKIITSWNIKLSLETLGMDCEYLIVDYKDSIDFVDGNNLKVIPIPYLKSPGTFIIYDEKRKVLFSGNLFGAIANNLRKYADIDYFDYIVAYHEYNFASSELLDPIIDYIDNMEIDLIAPFYGSMINKNIDEAINKIRNINAGVYSKHIAKKMLSMVNYKNLIKDITKKLPGKNDRIKEQMLSYTRQNQNEEPEKVLNEISSLIYYHKGLESLVLVKNIIDDFCIKYNIKTPSIIKEVLNETVGEINNLKQKLNNLEVDNKILKKTLDDTKVNLYKNDLTNLKNGKSFIETLSFDLPKALDEKRDNKIIFINVNNLSEINSSYGDTMGDETLRNVSILLRENKEEKHELYKLKGSLFAYYIKDGNDPYPYAERIINLIKDSDIFIEKPKISLSIVSFGEYFNEKKHYDKIIDDIFDMGQLRLKIAKGIGDNILFEDHMLKEYSEESEVVLIVDEDQYTTNILKNYLIDLGYRILTARNGEKALKIINESKIDLVISSISLPKLDGFSLKQKMNEKSNTRKIKFILIDFKKSPSNTKRAYSLGINYFIKKPFLIEEVVGIVNNIILGDYSA